MRNSNSKSACCHNAEQSQGSCCCSKPDKPAVSAVAAAERPSDGIITAPENNQTKGDCCGSDSEEGDEPASCCSSVKIAEKKSNCCSSSDHIQNTGKETPAQTSCCTAEASLNEASKTLPSITHFTVSGMDCGACAKTIEKSVQKLPGIQSAEVQFSTGKMRVTADKSALQTIPKAVAKLGYAAEEIVPKSANRQTYLVEGMDCGSCAKTIENHLRTIPQVNHVEVSFAAGNMHIDHNADNALIVREVKKAGYKATLASKRKHEQAEEKTSFDYEIFSVILSGLLIAVGVALSFTASLPFVSILLYAAAMVISGYKPVKSAYYAVKSRSLDMNVLMSAAAIGAAIIGEWLEGAVVVWLFSLGAMLQTRSVNRTRHSIKQLMDLAPSEAWVKKDAELVKVPVVNIALGEIIVVKPGDRIPLDGDILKGESSVNQSSITGESIPAFKTVNDAVFAGTVNENGTLEIKVTKLSEDTSLAKIIEMVEEAQGKQAPTQAFIDKFAAIYTPVVFAAALLVILIPPLLNLGSWNGAIYRGLELLVIACPCALVISTPVAIVSAIGNAAKNGVLIKGGTFLETAGKLDAIAFDKTGTITEGKPKVTDIEILIGGKQAFLEIAKTLEAYSNHPIANTITAYAGEYNIRERAGSNFQSITGKGVSASIDGVTYYAGNEKLFAELGHRILPPVVKRLQEQAKTLVIIGSSHEVIGVIGVEDTIRDTTVKAITELEQNGLKEMVMLTGDNEKTAALMAERAQVTRHFANLLPADKAAAIQKLQQEGYRTAMVGDGINDAPALATADIGIAMGGAGTDTAIETADIVLMADNLEKLPFTIQLSKRALNIIRQNIIFSILLKVAALLLIMPGWLTLWLAVLSDTGAAILVILNSLRLFKNK